jgi:hypothetical protein
LVKWLERTPTPAALTEGVDSPILATALPATVSTSRPVTSTDCEPAGITELPAQAVAVIESVNGVVTTVPLESLRFEYRTSLRLASGGFVDFSRMKRVDLINPIFTDPFTVEVTITLLDCTVHRDIVNSGSDSNLTGDSALGAFQLHILHVKSIVFEW